MLLSLSASGPSAEASFPGANGRIFFEQGKNIYTIGPDGTGKKLVARAKDFKGKPDLEDPAISPNGKLIAFSTNSDIFVGNLTTGKVKNVTGKASDRLTLTHLRYPAWSRDGKKLIFQAVRTLKATLYRINRDGSGIKQLIRFRQGVFSIYNTYPDWSSQNKIVFTAQSNLWTMNPDGSSVTNLTQIEEVAEEGFAEPSWSPDGTQIAADHAVDGAFPDTLAGIVVVDGTSGEVLSEVTGNEIYGRETYNSPSWSPDGQWIAFTGFHTDRGPDYDIHIIKASGEEEPIDLNTVSPLSDNESYDPAWAPAS